MPPFVQPNYGIIKGCGDKLRDTCNEMKGKIRNWDFQKLWRKVRWQMKQGAL